MKHTKREQRKAFRKWAMPEQRTQTMDMEKLNARRFHAEMIGGARPENIGKNNGRLNHAHAQPVGKPLAFVAMVKSHDGLLPRNVGRSNGGATVPSKGKKIPAHLYSAYLESAHLS